VQRSSSLAAFPSPNTHITILDIYAYKKSASKYFLIEVQEEIDPQGGARETTAKVIEATH
jgi:hypothetical protein